MIAASTFSGVGGLDLGLTRAGFDHAFFAEADRWRRRVLGAHYPGAPIYHDVRDASSHRSRPSGHGSGPDHGPLGGPTGLGVDLLAGGFPCQDVSVAGARAGLAGARSGLFHEFARIAEIVRPAWLLIENVPGLLTSNDGRDFGVVVGTLADLGYGVAWRVLDARYFGVPQRRRRVFIVGRAGGDHRSALSALCSSCEGGPAASRCTWQEPAARARGGPAGGSWGDEYFIEDGVNGTLRAGSGGQRTDRQPLIARSLNGHHDRHDATSQTYVGVDVAATLQGRRGAGGGALGPEETLVPVAAPELADTLTAGGHPNSAVPGRHQEDDVNLVAGTLRSHPRPGSAHPGALTAFNVTPEGDQGADLRATEVDVAPAVAPQTGSYDRGIHLASAVGVRRLTPTECERLMGWPDGWTAPDGVKAPDTKRYAACGDGVVANVSEWIGRRIIAVEASCTA